MLSNDNGWITEHFFVAGPAGMPVYLLDGPAPVLFDAGNAVLADRYLRDLLTVLGDRPPAYLFLTHSHFDHLGAVVRFKEFWPELKVCASAKTQEVLSKPKAVELMALLTREAAKTLRMWGLTDITDRPFSAFDLDLVLEPEQVIDLGDGRTIHVMATPGHTWDFLSYWVSSDRVLVASEAVGCQENCGNILPEFLVDYDTYLESLLRLRSLEAQVLATGHHYVVTGNDVPDYFRRSLVNSAEYVAMLEDFLAVEEGNIEATVRRVKAANWDVRPWPKQPEAAFMLNTKARVKVIRDRLERNGQNGPRKISA